MKGIAIDTTPKWNQDAINRILSEYNRNSDGQEILGEQLWWMIRSEVMLNLRSKLKNDMAVEEAEYAALREFNRRLNGGVHFLRRSYISYITNTAVRFVAKRRSKIVAFESENSPAQNLASPDKNPEETSTRYADLYFCIGKLNKQDKTLIGLHHARDIGLEEVAGKLSTTHDAARKRHSRILTKLRLCLKEIGFGGRS